MLGVLGAGYFADALTAAAERRRQTELYRVYQTDCLRATAAALGVRIGKRYCELLRPAANGAEESAAGRLRRFGIKVVE
ncbi:MAG: hypothetical protein IKE30_07930 [Clostridia bacterium]|nr:hypothetical protein [Clostridia bacterium]